MNEIRFDIQHSEFGNLVVPVIDGKSLISILKDVEKSFARKEGYLKLAGEYKGIPIEFIESPSNYYQGITKTDLLNGKTVILDCPCLIIGCWSFVARIKIEKDKIVWKDFEQIHRDNWNYSGLDRFVYEKTKYQNVLEELENKKIL